MDCADEVRSARATRRVLSSGLGDVCPAPEFMNRLLALAAQTEPVAHGGGAAGVVGAAVRFAEPQRLPPRWQALCGDLPSGDLSLGGPPRAVLRRRRRVVAAALVATGVAASGLFALGSRPVVTPARYPADAFTALAGAVQWTPDVSPAVVTASAGDGSDWADGPGGYDHEVLEWMQVEGWPRPDALPAGLQVRSLRFTGSDATVLEVDLESPIGDVVIREQKGQLSPILLDELESVAVGGSPVYVISAEPLHLVWQSSDTVIDLVSAASLDDVLQLVSTFSVDEFDTGFQARVERGWSTLTGVLS
ncbi:hypothetical protein SAMN05216410_1874 [Sanguibacter gelidistatuariae]|uniref:Uncharacterized protein n=2 Tax=Sanguibacter gelidistatuariae TaxID=1814289 RepID=A0A1G6MH05_9MICO|nr:hypothetical protein SAMN05216410_1874 [Sanguibacter gelidistatuariae]